MSRVSWNFWGETSRSTINVWAIAETAVATITFWALALRYGSLVIFAPSVALAPLFFLKSRRSTTLAIRAFERGFFPYPPSSPGQRRNALRWRELGWLAIAGTLTTATTAAVMQLSLVLHLPNISGWIGTIVGILTTAAALIIAEAISAATAATIRGKPRITAVAASASLLIGTGLTSLFSVTIYLLGHSSREWATGAMSGSVCVVMLTTLAIWLDGRKKVFGLVVVAAIVCCPGSQFGLGKAGAERLKVNGATALIVGVLVACVLFLSVWLSSLVVRITSTAVYLWRGYQSMPANIRRLALCAPPGQRSEIIPDLPVGHNFTFERLSFVATRESSTSTFLGSLAATPFRVFSFIWIIVGWFYRFVLKSTLWFWWILVFVGGIANHYKNARLLDIKRNRVLIAKILIIWTLITLAQTAIKFVLPAYWTNWIQDNQLLPLACIFLIDFSDFSILQMANLTSACCSLVLWLYANLIVEHSEEPTYDLARNLRRINYIAKIHTGVVVMSFEIVALYLVLLIASFKGWQFSAIDDLSWWLKLLYGDYARALFRLPVVPTLWTYNS